LYVFFPSPSDSDSDPPPIVLELVYILPDPVGSGRVVRSLILMISSAKNTPRKKKPWISFAMAPSLMKLLVNSRRTRLGRVSNLGGTK
jgi:hypothetical protein